MRGVNKVILVGTLGKDPETKTFPNGGSITQFSIATSESWMDKNTGERKEQTEWHRIVLNNRLGEIAQQYLRKGSKVYIEGSLRTRQWTDQNGQERYATEIRGEQMQMLDSRQSQQNQGDSAYGGGNSNYQNPYNSNTGNQYNQGFNSPNTANQNNGNQAGGYNNQAPQGGYGNQANSGNGYGNQGGFNTPPVQKPAPAAKPAASTEPDDDLPF